MASREQMKISASRLLQRWPLHSVSSRVARLVGPAMLHELALSSSATIRSPGEALEALFGVKVDYEEEYAAVRDRVASGAKNDGNYPDYYVIEEGTAYLLYALVRHLRPELILEVGVAAGRSTRTILSALDANEAGRLVSVDIADDVGGGAKGHPRWTLRIHAPGRTAPDQLEALITEIGPPDLFFHDASHTYYDQYAEYIAAYDAMRRGSLFVSDDIDQSRAFLDLVTKRGVRPVIITERNKAAGAFLRP